MKVWLKLSNYQKFSILILSIFVFSFVSLRHFALAETVIKPTNSSDVGDSTVTGEAYISNDPSAFNSTKITFGYPNSASFIKTKSMNTAVKISTGNLSNNSLISSLDYGSNEIWYDNGFGAQNPSNNQIYSSVISATQNTGVSVLRFPGGIPSDTYHWQYAIGPQNSRQENVVYQSNDTFLKSNFGPDEFGQLLSDTGAVGNITVNFGTGTAQEAADWVQYMTASSTSNYWGKLRAQKTGHPAPYSIPYWEVGNEQQSLELYWRKGTVVKIGNNDGTCKSTDVHLCEYVYGGTTAFSNQPLLSQSNKVSNGSANQIYYVKYPPLVPNSQKLLVNNEQWQEVANFSGAAPNSKVYTINTTTGKVAFGNGTNGAIPAGAAVTISYQSGPHNGFIQYYQLMKSADPSARICSSYDSSGFMALMGSAYPYDCLDVHLYGQKISSLADTALFHDELMQQSSDFAATLQITRTNLNKYAGKNAKKIQIAVTEYGVNALTSPLYQSNYHRSLDIALFVANSLRVFINNHIPIAEKHYLISDENASASGVQTFFNSGTFADNALFGGPGNNLTVQPSAYAMEAYSKLSYKYLISSKVTSNPQTVFSSGSYPSLETLATTDNKGDEAILVINLSSTQDILSEVEPSLNSYPSAVVWSLGANSILAYNTPSDPDVVGFIKNTVSLHAGKLLGYFPPSSITVIQFKK